MAYNSYFANVISRLVFLLATFIGVAYLLVNTSRFFTVFFLSALAIIQIISLIFFLNKTNRNLARFLLALTEEDTSVIAWKDRIEHTFQGLHHSFSSVNEEIQRIRLENEKGSILLQNIIDHIHTGIFAVNEDGLIELVNKEALKIFDINGLKKLQDLDRLQDGLADEFSNLRYDSGNILNLSLVDDEQMPVMVQVSAFKLGNQKLKLYSLQGVKNELEANEIESWQKLTRVLAHEIANSVTPISTLGAGIHRKLSQVSLEKDGGMHIPGNAAADLLQSSELISQRGNALVEFVDHYKSFSRLPDPVMVWADLSQLFKNVSRYFSDELKQSGISLSIEVSDELREIHADPNLMEQAMINLVRNAIYALMGHTDGLITLRGKLEGRNEVILEISDNGPGISPPIQSQVFIPFFTTKQKGTGIGLSIVKKILNMHGGSIHFQTWEGGGTTFIIRLPPYLPV